ncbi:MAG: hypothetical protein EX285_06660 [Thaumarchaeota archaeon]|nr:hypothetical protein [Nitrososphaerota archaeon]
MVFKYDELDWREKEILNAILENPNLSHNLLRRHIIERREFMSGDAFEKAIKRLKDAGWLRTTKDKNTLIYDVPKLVNLADPKNDERARTILVSVIEKWNTEWKTEFHKLELKEKVKSANDTLKGLQEMRNYFETSWLVAYGRIDRTEAQKEIRSKMDELFATFFKIISDDSDADRIKFAFTLGTLRLTGDSASPSVDLTEEYFSAVLDYAVKKSDDPNLPKWKEGYDAFMKTASAGDKEVILKVLSGEIEPNIQAVEEYRKKDKDTALAKAEDALKRTEKGLDNVLETMTQFTKTVDELKKIGELKKKEIKP